VIVIVQSAVLDSVRVAVLALVTVCEVIEAVGQPDNVNAGEPGVPAVHAAPIPVKLTVLLTPVTTKG
jgi:hypothetical protein